MFNFKLFFSKSKKSQNLIIISLLFIGVMACSDPNDPNVRDTITFSGQAADGYLRNANVFFDCNNNKVWDSDELTSRSGEQGKFTFYKKVDTNNCALMVDASDTSVVIDEADMKDGKYQTLAEAGREGFVLSAPKGRTTFVSPFTTLAEVYNDDELEGLLPSLGLTNKNELYENYISADDLPAQLRGEMLAYLFSYQKLKLGPNYEREYTITRTMKYFSNDYKNLNFSNKEEVKQKIEMIRKHTKNLTFSRSSLSSENQAILKRCEENVTNGSIAGIKISEIFNLRRDISYSFDQFTFGGISDNFLPNGEHYYTFLNNTNNFTRLALYVDGVSSNSFIGNTILPLRLGSAESETQYEKKDINIIYTSYTEEVTTNYLTTTSVKCDTGVYAYKLKEVSGGNIAYVTDKTR